MSNITMSNKHSFITQSAQRGTIALLMSLIILTLITFVSLYTAKTVSVEQKISGNEFRSRVAFEAAEAGMEAAMTYIDRSNGGYDRNANNDLTDENIYDASGNIVIDTAGVQNWREYDNNSKTIVRLDGTVTKQGVTVNITSIGISGDGSAQRTISKTVAVVDPLPGFPNVPFSARGAVAVQGNFSVVNPEGNSTIRSGGTFAWESGGASSETFIADPSHGNYPECLGGSNACDNPSYSGSTGCPASNYVKCGTIKVSDAGTSNIDIDQNFLGFKNATEDEYFRNMFGVSKSYFRSHRVSRFVDWTEFNEHYTDGGVDESHGEVLWVDVPAGEELDIGGLVAGCHIPGGGNVNAKSTPFDENCSAAGGKLDPIILVINGDIDVTASPKFFGMVYITGDISGTGSPEIQGAMAQEKTASNIGMNGTPRIWYDSAILEMASGNGPFATATGTWRDF
jgi:Tfp pilus assembly protein PilX